MNLGLSGFLPYRDTAHLVEVCFVNLGFSDSLTYRVLRFRLFEKSSKHHLSGPDVCSISVALLDFKSYGLFCKVCCYAYACAGKR